MKFGFRAHDTLIKDDSAKLARQLAHDGVPYVQFAPRLSLPRLTHNGEQVSFGLASQVADDFRQNNVRIAILGGYVNIMHPDVSTRKIALHQFKLMLSRASSFGASIVATETGSLDPSFHKTTDNFQPAVVEETIRVIQELVAEAEKVGVMVGIEPGVNHPIYSLATTRQLLDEVNSPNLKIILDPVSLIMEPADDAVVILKAAIRALGSHIYAYHLKDYRYEADHIQVVPTGEGEADLKGMLQAINQEQPQAFVIADELVPGALEQSKQRWNALAADI